MGDGRRTRTSCARSKVRLRVVVDLRFKNGKVVESWGLNDGLLGMIQLGGIKPPQM